MCATVFLSEEMAKVDAEIAREIGEFERAWAEHEGKLTAAVLKVCVSGVWLQMCCNCTECIVMRQGKLGDGWVLQDLPGQQPAYLNLKTGDGLVHTLLHPCG